VIVDVLTPIEESADGEATVEGRSVEAKVEEDAGPKFIGLLKKILPHVKRALAKPTSVSAELQSRVREAQELGRQRDFQQGLATLKIVGQLTKQALAESEAAPAASGPAQEFVERSKKVRSLAQDSEVEQTSVAKEIAQLLAEADTFSQRNQIERANRALERAERWIDLAQAETRRRQQWEARFAEFEPRYNERSAVATPEASQMRVIMNYATRQAERKQFVKALTGLNRLERLLQS
jgi:hypothetical protein